jgi:hypothetical protein
MNTLNTKRLTVAAGFCLALASFSAIPLVLAEPAIATEPTIAPAEAAATYKVAVSGMT